MEDNNVFLSENELNCLFEKLDLSEDGRITYTEIVQELTPKLTAGITAVN